MNNHPFYSSNRNIYDQSLFAARPTNLHGQNVLVSQEQQRKMYDTLNTSIVGLQNYNSQVLNSMNQPQGNFMQAQRQFIPGGVMFTFNSQPINQLPAYMNVQSQQPACYCSSNVPNNNYFPPTLEQQIAVTGIQNHGLESLQYQQQLANNPFQLKFHLDKGTSSSDLLKASTQIPGSCSTPDFCNIGGVSPTSNMSLDYADFSRNTRRLNLCSQPENKPEQTSSQCNETDLKKKVSFAKEQSKGRVDIGQQVSLSCPYCNAKNNFKCVIGNNKKEKSSKKAPPKSRRKRDDDDSLSDSTENESGPSTSNESHRSRRNRSDSQYGSDSGYSG